MLGDFPWVEHSEENPRVWLGTFLYGDAVFVLVAKSCGCHTVMDYRGLLPTTPGLRKKEET